MNTVVLSHRTANLLFHSGLDLRAAPRLPDASDIERARCALLSLGIADPGELDIIVPSASLRCRRTGVSCHVCSCLLPEQSIIRLAEGVFVVCPELCFVQMASCVGQLELVELGYEFCGSYELPLDGGDYRDRKPLTSVRALTAYMEQIAGSTWVAHARRALRYVMDGSRSPLETAFAMMLALPKRAGGLGLRALKMDHRIEVSKNATSLTRRHHLFCDLFVRHAKLDIEYNGFLHDEGEQQAIDEERRRALEVMGYKMATVSRWSFFDAPAFHRVMTSICRKSGIRPSRLPGDFSFKREKLRKFVLRRWLE